MCRLDKVHKYIALLVQSRFFYHQALRHRRAIINVGGQFDEKYKNIHYIPSTYQNKWAEQTAHQLCKKIHT